MIDNINFQYMLFISIKIILLFTFIIWIHLKSKIEHFLSFFKFCQFIKAGPLVYINIYKYKTFTKIGH